MKNKEIKGRELSHGNVKETDRLHYSEETEMWVVRDTPFAVAREKNEWFVLMGNYRLTEAIGSRDEAMEEARVINWNKIIQVMTVAMELNKRKEVIDVE